MWTSGTGWESGVRRTRLPADERQHGEGGSQPVDARLRVHVRDVGDHVGGEVCLGERVAQLLVGQEGHASGELGAGLCFDLLGNRRVLGHVVEERGRERGDEDRPRQCGAERRAEVDGGVLQTAHLRALLVRHRGHCHRTELRGQCSDSESCEQQRNGHDPGVGLDVDRGEQHDDPDEHGDQAQPHHETW
ncbi:hypothetical protein [Lentzea tibetensis]|uniref:hypothetical protein n=1 Tax=Lentzea tibetensis TaxID=2591470 RepID=UPI001F3B082A|nr:hypothetical protein [Lentzea tibetensis]